MARTSRGSATSTDTPGTQPRTGSPQELRRIETTTTGHARWVSWPKQGAALVSDRVGFWALASLLGVLMFAASAPSPLYEVYAAQWHFSSAMLTLVFAVYAVALLAALLVAGRLSDHVGRRPVIAASLVIEMVAMGCFIAADSTMLLCLARVTQGLATGTAIGAMSAALVDFSMGRSPGLASVVNSAAPTVGLAVGALGTSALVQYGPAPTRLVYWLLLAVFLVGTVVVMAMRETGERRPGALRSLVPQASLPSSVRVAFARVLPCLVALWALGGFYLSLGPGLAAALVSSRNLLWGGLVIALLTGTGAGTAILCRRTAERPALLWGCIALFAGVAITLIGVVARSAVPFLGGSAIAGIGFGLAFLGAFRTLSGLAGPDERAGVIASIYIVSYLSFSIPVVSAGIAATTAGLHAVSVTYAAVVAGLAALGVLFGRRTAPRPVTDAAAPQETEMELPPCPGTVPLCVHGGTRTATAPR